MIWNNWLNTTRVPECHDHSFNTGLLFYLRTFIHQCCLLYVLCPNLFLLILIGHTHILYPPFESPTLAQLKGYLYIHIESYGEGCIIYLAKLGMATASTYLEKYWFILIGHTPHKSRPLALCESSDVIPAYLLHHMARDVFYLRQNWWWQQPWLVWKKHSAMGFNTHK